MYKNITLVAFISAFTLTACGGGGSSTVPTSNGSSKSALSSATLSSSKSSVSSSSLIASSNNSSIVVSSVSSTSFASAPGETVSSSSVVASSSSSIIVPVSSSSVKSSSSTVRSSSSSVRSSSSSIPSSSSSVAKSSSSVTVSSSSVVASSSSSVSSGPASIYHVRGSFNNWQEGTLMSRVGSSDVYELCANFTANDAGDGGNGPRFKVDPNGGWGSDSSPVSDYMVTLGWVKISYNSVTKEITALQNLPANCSGASSSSSSVVSSSSLSSSSVVSSSVKSSSSSIVAPSSSSVASSSAAPSSSSSSAASSLGHYAGEDCASCHVAGGTAEKKIFTIAGTVYKAATKSEALNPATLVNTAASIVIMDEADSTPVEVIRVQTDANGNFYSYASLGSRALSDLTPHAFGTAGAELAMSGVPSTGSCNSCHNRTATRMNPPIYIK